MLSQEKATLFSVLFSTVNQNPKCPKVFNTEISIFFHGKQPDKYDLLLGTIIPLCSNGQEWRHCYVTTTLSANTTFITI